MEHKLNITIEARYFSHGNPQAETVIVALHGYGQLGAYFLKKFEFLDPEKYLVIVPEGLHHFYVSGTSGRVGASWMTKENRETDIRNYITYLDAILEKTGVAESASKKILLGFSQGGATASRYLAAGSQKFDAFILWAAVFPPDMNPEKFAAFNTSQNFLVVGDQDKYYKTEDIVIEQEKLAVSGMKFDLVQFKGEHTVDQHTLKTILDEI
ncbi:MAG: alpha/beta hydrolase [Bacteroidetes bacterium]|nr:alpha/beta hydrolase [Bacteroidota bacterium]